MSAISNELGVATDVRGLIDRLVSQTVTNEREWTNLNPIYTTSLGAGVAIALSTDGLTVLVSDIDTRSFPVIEVEFTADVALLHDLVGKRLAANPLASNTRGEVEE